MIASDLKKKLARQAFDVAVDQTGKSDAQRMYSLGVAQYYMLEAIYALMEEQRNG